MRRGECYLAQLRGAQPCVGCHSPCRLCCAVLLWELCCLCFAVLRDLDDSLLCDVNEFSAMIGFW